jgi:hypothetical protein
MQLEDLIKKIDDLIAFEPRWYKWMEMDKQSFKNLPLLQLHETELRDFLVRVEHDMQVLEVQDTGYLNGLKYSIKSKLK